MIIHQYLLGDLNNFTYLIACEKTQKALVIDPALKIEPVITEAEKSNMEISYIINTHGHADHVAGNVRLKELTQAGIAMHRLDAKQYNNVDIKLQLV